MKNKIDHVSVGTDSLGKGSEALQALLGVALTKGSKHDLMSTHNRVMQAGNELSLIHISEPTRPY